MACCNNPNFPSRIAAGIDLEVSASFPAYKAPDWTLSIVLRGAGSIDLTAEDNGTGFKFTVPGSTTGTWAAGDYWYSMRASNGANTVEVERGEVRVEPDLSAVTGEYDGRTDKQKALNAIDAVLSKRATIDQQRYIINNRELWRTPIADLLKLRAYYATQVRREKACRNGQSTFGRRIEVRFR